MSVHQDTADAVAKLVTAWGLFLWGWITLQHVVLVASLVYTLLQTYVLVRDKIAKKEGKCSTD